MKKIIIILLSSMSTLMADTIKVRNKSDFDLFASVYAVGKDIQLKSKIVAVPSRGKAKIERPSRKVGVRRRLVFSLNEGDLKHKLTSSEYHILPSNSVSTELGTNYYIALDKGALKGYGKAEWKVIEPVRKKLAGVMRKLDNATLGQIRRRYTDLPLAGKTVLVRKSTDLPLEEKNYLKVRTPKVKKALEKLVGKKLTDKQVPRIMFCASGGGYRAMLGTLGSLLGSEKIGLLDTASYISGVSGSTWLMGPWIQSGYSLTDMKGRLIRKINKDFYAISLDPKKMIERLAMRVAFKQPVTPINLYSRLLAENLLSDLPGGPDQQFLYQQAERMKSGNWIFPIYTAVLTKLPHQWVEFTPFEVGSDYLGGYIPAAAFGAPFLKGKMQYATPPYSLSFILAIAGSAFAAQLKTVLAKMGKKIPYEPLKNALRYAIEDTSLGTFRVAAAEVYNWTYGMQPLPRAQQELIRLIDAGIFYNLGFEALYRRKPDIIVVFDNSGSKSVGLQLELAQKELKARGFKVPPIQMTITQSCTVFKDPNDPTVPIIIYLPLELRECLDSWCSTYNFKYTPDQAERLINSTEKALVGCKDKIIGEIKQWIDKH